MMCPCEKVLLVSVPQALQKLASQYLKREWLDCRAEDEGEPR